MLGLLKARGLQKRGNKMSRKSEQQKQGHFKDVLVQCPSCFYEFVNPQWGTNGECNSCHKEYISFGKCSCIRCEE